MFPKQLFFDCPIEHVQLVTKCILFIIVIFASKDLKVIFFNLVNKPMSNIDSPGPKTSQIKFKWFRFSNPIIMTSLNILYQGINFL